MNLSALPPPARWALVPVAFIVGWVLVPWLQGVLYVVTVGLLFPWSEWCLEIAQSASSGLFAVSLPYLVAPTAKRETAIVAGTAAVTLMMVVGLLVGANLWAWFHIAISSAVAVATAVAAARDPSAR